MDYSYNYGYLQQYMDIHKLAKKDLLEALGCNDYVSLNKWLDGKVPVHVTALLRFCNYYNVPLCNFFVDGDGMPCDFAPLMPDESAQLLPTDNYGMKEGRGRGIVETRISARIVTSPAQTQAVAEGLKVQAEQRNRRDAALAQMRQREDYDPTEPKEDSTPTLPDTSMVETILRMKLDHSNEIRSLEQQHREKEDSIRERQEQERDRLMGIIEQQAKEIARLSSPRQLRAYNHGEHNNINMVAESEAEYGQQ